MAIGEYEHPCPTEPAHHGLSDLRSRRDGANPGQCLQGVRERDARLTGQRLRVEKRSGQGGIQQGTRRARRGDFEDRQGEGGLAQLQVQPLLSGHYHIPGDRGVAQPAHDESHPACGEAAERKASIPGRDGPQIESARQDLDPAERGTRQVGDAAFQEETGARGPGRAGYRQHQKQAEKDGLIGPHAIQGSPRSREIAAQ